LSHEAASGATTASIESLTRRIGAQSLTDREPSRLAAAANAGGATIEIDAA